MNIILDPPRGVAPVNIGLPVQEALEAASVWGEVRVLNRGPNRPPKVSVTNADKFQVNLHFEDGKTVTAIEIWRFVDPSVDVRVLFQGMDLFRTPARQIMKQLREKGFDLRNEKDAYPRVARLSLGFTREAGRKVPMDKDKMPFYFEAVLVGDASYFV